MTTRCHGTLSGDTRIAQPTVRANNGDERIQAMLLINMVAILVYTLLERQVRRQGLPLTTRRILEQGSI